MKTNMATFNETLAQLTVAQLKKLERILAHLDRNANCPFDEVLAQLTSTHSTQSKPDAELIGARAYELTISEGLDFKLARKQAFEEFESGKLKHQIKRYRSHTQTAVATPAALQVPPLPPTQNNAPATLAGPSAPKSLPDHVIPITTKLNFDSFHSKCFHSTHDENGVW
jgi:dTDP-4-amino-4,6-dideoxygalactose transaminase